MASRIFDASRKAAEALKNRSRSGGERRGINHSIEGRRSIRAELDAMKHQDKRLPYEKFSIEEARRVLHENSVGEGTRNMNLRSTSQNIMSSTNSEQLLFTGTLQGHMDRVGQVAGKARNFSPNEHRNTLVALNLDNPLLAMQNDREYEDEN